MARLILIAVVVVLLGMMLRRALLAATKDSALKPRPRRGPHLPPDRLVCGVCGESFDPEQTGWLCPKCGK